ncbi:4-hydroxy-tetrahydrodipicolinate reductase [Sutterella sp.]|uniref:4-hydroxy-tetrahydrodipicolinate reductase n=1 Tax=Sutterella sp. TaxID=1981025 RepID=UPI0026DF3EEC|nr:4-hydroxy-tetrahydrodipicolinate reductase [Sutterella sp.]MDO5532087.1 4-hydroxy-tetrahydrodipicolinate reductase [Sutterella sp.]
MKIALVGTGRMGRMISECAAARGVEVAGAYDANNIDELAQLGPVDAVIDFSAPASLDAVEAYIRRTGAALVSGTTGYTADQLARIQALGDVAPVIQSANYSVGVAVLKRLAAIAAKQLGGDFDIEITETHHRMKADAPSGTAKLLVAAIDPEGKRKVVNGREGMMKRTAGEGSEIGVHALRGGTVAGVHTVSFFGEDEEVSLTHRAESRRIFALGALRAAQLLAPRAKGIYTLDTLLFPEA